MLDGIKLVCLSANKELTKRIAEILEVPIMDSELTHFADGEILFGRGSDWERFGQDAGYAVF